MYCIHVLILILVTLHLFRVSVLHLLCYICLCDTSQKNTGRRNRWKAVIQGGSRSILNNNWQRKYWNRMHMKAYSMKCVKKVSSLLLNWPRRKWATNDMLIFFKIVSLKFNIFQWVFHRLKHLWNSSFKLVSSCIIIFLLISSLSSKH